MNHYERLKVSQDAPAEVIRAAYRALAAKLHPDRQGADTGPDDAMHDQMAALNMAYEVLIDPKLRQDYDATLAPSAPFGGFGGVARGSHELDADLNAAPSHRVDLDWLPPKSAAPPAPLWPPSQHMMLLGGSGLAVVILATSGMLWQFMGQRQMEQAMSAQYVNKTGDNASVATMPAETPQQPRASLAPDSAMPRSAGTSARPDDLPPAVASAMPGAKPGARHPSVDELARMSDDELLKVLPTLDDGANEAVYAAVRSNSKKRGAAHHPLDGRPLNLRTDRELIDPLATPEPAPARPTRRP